jgi:hypothetical protein
MTAYVMRCFAPANARIGDWPGRKSLRPRKRTRYQCRSSTTLLKYHEPILISSSEFPAHVRGKMLSLRKESPTGSLLMRALARPWCDSSLTSFIGNAGKNAASVGRRLHRTVSGGLAVTFPAWHGPDRAIHHGRIRGRRPFCWAIILSRCLMISVSRSSSNMGAGIFTWIASMGECPVTAKM